MSAAAVVPRDPPGVLGVVSGGGGYPGLSRAPGSGRPRGPLATPGEGGIGDCAFGGEGGPRVAAFRSGWGSIRPTWARSGPWCPPATETRGLHSLARLSGLPTPHRIMGKDKASKHSSASQPKIDQFTAPASSRGGGDTPIESHTSPDGVNAILQAIQTSQLAGETKIGEVKEDVGLIRQDLRNAVGRITTVEARVSQTEDDLAELRTKVTQLLSRIGELHQRAEDAENRSWRNNLRFIGFPEGA
ncbi:hypothetical protein NDU88_003985 [Pleurodeles waltl]|uniref:Uncharacterized protein n=1 Tax=Pleurodeles waltl TaxID=8319 RepID=A0AAV7RJR6_PLEWA|nr:hypothetical protein NDU88_003985 [Pleurodeles waltl]